MAVPSINEIEHQFAQLPTEGQLTLLERLVHNLRENFGAQPNSWGTELSAMAADPQMQKELQVINAEFKSTECDGLGRNKN